jgi:hypothetical protein
MNRYRAHLITLTLYTLLALLLTRPLAAHLTTHVPGEPTWAFDESTFLWNMWWLKFSLLNLGQPPLESNHIFFPLGIHLTTYTFNLFNAALGLPLQLVFSLPLASNLVLLFSFISSGYGVFLLCLYLFYDHSPIRQAQGRRQAADRRPSSFLSPPYWAAFAAGAVYAFSASRMMYAALGHYNFVTIQWLPFFTLFLLKTLRRGGVQNIFLTGLFAALCLYTELTFSVFLIFITLLLWLETMRRGSEETRKKLSASPQPRLFASSLLRLCAIGLVAFILTAPLILAVLPDFLDPAYAEPGWGEALNLSADLVGLVTLTPLHPLSGLDWRSELRAVIESTARFNDVNTLFLGYGIVALALLGYIFNRRQGRVWLWMAIIFTVLSLGPLLTINGQNRFNLNGLDVTLPMPFVLLQYIPFINANRVPNRFGIPLSLALAVLVGMAVIGLWLKVKSSTFNLKPVTFYALNLPFFILVLVVLLFDQYSVPLPLSDARIPPVYAQIGAEPDNFTVMTLPLGWRNSYGTLGAEQTQLQYFQSAHQHPLIGGNTSRSPAFKFDYFARIPLFAALTDTELYRPVDETTLQRARQQAAELMTLYDIKYLAVHEPIPHRKPYEDTYLATRNLALDLISHQPDPVYESPGVQVFAVQPADIPNPLTLDFGDWRSDPYRGEGWSGNEEIFAATANWAIAPKAQIFFPVAGRGDRRLTLHIAPFTYPAAPPQSVSLSLNDQPLADSLLSREGWQTIEATLPESLLSAGLNRLTLHFTHTAQPRQVLPATTGIGQTGVNTPVDLELNSGGDFAFITVGFGPDAVDASVHRRGVNVAVVEPKSGQVTAIKGFDTAANSHEAAALRQFIEGIPAGQIVLVATQGLDAVAFFDDTTWAALQSLGLDTAGLTLPFSAIGVKGAAPGAAQQANGEGAAYLRLGPSPDTRNLAAAVDKVVIEQP